MTGQLYRVVFPNGSQKDIIMEADETGFIKDVLDDRFKELTGFYVRDVPRDENFKSEYKLLYIGPFTSKDT